VKAFAYVNAGSQAEALAALSTARRGRTVPLAGGMDLVGLMKDYVIQPDVVVNVKALPSEIAVPAQGQATVGAAARLADVAGHEALAKAYPAFAEAAGWVGTPQIRNMGTVGGNLMQRPRCWYFRNEEFHCLKKGGARCFAVGGENQYHAIFGDGPCHIVHPSTLAVPLIAYGGRVRAAGPEGEREIEADRFFVMPDRNMYGETVLEPNELVTAILLPPQRRSTLSATYEVKFKQSHDWPIASAAVALQMNGSVVDSARVVLGYVAPIPWRSQAAEQVLRGKRVDESVAWQAAEAALADAKPMSQNAYKIQVAKTALRRAIMKATGATVV
jgi:xanthine dehydrogenase YagS FAD-binding subunit